MARYFLMRNHGRRGFFSLLSGIMLVVVIGALLFSVTNPLLWPADILVKEDRVSEADVIVLLLGGAFSRSQKAAELYREGLGKKVVFGRVETTDAERHGYIVNEADIATEMLVKAGVPSEDILQIESPRVTSTIDEARLLLAEVNKQLPEAHSLVIVTDWYHSARARWIFDKFNRYGFRLMSVAAVTEKSRPETWYVYEDSFIVTLVEYIKWLYYLIHYGGRDAEELSIDLGPTGGGAVEKVPH